MVEKCPPGTRIDKILALSIRVAVMNNAEIVKRLAGIYHPPIV